MATIDARLSALEVAAEKMATVPPSITVIYVGADGKEARRVEVPIPTTGAAADRPRTVWIERSYGRPAAK